MFKKFLILLMFLFLITNAFALTSSDAFSYWNFDETTGTTLYDQNDLANEDGTNVGGLSINQPGYINTTYYGYSAGSKHINFGDSSRIDPTSTDAYSICSWIKNDANPGGTIIAKVPDSCGKSYWSLYISGATDKPRMLVSRDCGGGGNAEGDTVLSSGIWYFICGTFDGTTNTNGIKIYVNSVLDGEATYVGSGTVQSSAELWIGDNPRFQSDPFKGWIDEVTFWDRELSENDIISLYGNKDFYIVNPNGDVNYRTTIDVNFLIKDATEENTISSDFYISYVKGAKETSFYSDSNILDGVGIVCEDYNFLDDTYCSFSQSIFIDENYYYIDGNILIGVQSINSSSEQFYFYPTGTTADFNWFIDKSNSQINLYDQSINTDVTINDWNWLVDGSTTGLDDTDAQNPVYSGATQNTDYNVCLSVGGIGEDSNYYSDSICQTINSGRWYADWNITVYDENSEAKLSGVTLNVSDGINSEEFTIDQDIYLNYDGNLSTILGTTTEQITLTFSKDGYGTRYYEFDANKYSDADLDINFMLLPTSFGKSIEFQVYKPDQATLFTDTYIELFNWNKHNWIANRRKSDSEAKVTFYINPNDANYTMRSNETTDYNATVLTVTKPKDEDTGINITGNWKMSVGGLAWQNYTGITNSQEIQVYANTVDEYELSIVDDNSDYYERKYFVSYTGGTTAESIQPYLVPVSSAVSTTIYTIDGYTGKPVPGIVVIIYKQIVGVGRVIVEQISTDAKGEALISLIANDSYEFEVYRNGVKQGTKDVIATSASIYISVDSVGFTEKTLEEGLVNVRFVPYLSKLTETDTDLNQIITIDAQGINLDFTSVFIYVTNTDVNGVRGNDVNIYSTTITELTNSIDLNTIAQTLGGVSYDTNGKIIVYVEVTTSQGKYYDYHIYSPVTGFDFYKAINWDLRPIFGCTQTNDPLIPCPGMLLIALLVSILITVAFQMETGMMGQNGMAGIFLIIAGVFTYFGWIPIGLMGIMAVGVIMLMLAAGRMKYA